MPAVALILLSLEPIYLFFEYSTFISVADPFNFDTDPKQIRPEIEEILTFFYELF